MTNRHVVVGLNWDGYDVQRQDFGVLLDITEGLDDLPELRSQRQIVPFRHGRIGAAPFADRRVIVLTGLLDGRDGTDRSPYRVYVDEVKEAFSPFRSTPGVLVATLEDGTVRWIRAMPIDMRPIPIVPGSSRYSIELVASEDPFWHGSYGYSTLDSGLFLDDGEYLDQGGEIIVTPSSISHTVTFDTFGTADVERVRLQFVGPSLNAVGIEVDTPDGLVGFTIAAALEAGEQLVVDNYARTALIGAVPQRQFMTLKAGNRGGEYVRFLPRLNTVRILGAPASARILLTPTFL